MLRTLPLLIAAAVGGVVVSTSLSCGAFLLVYTPGANEWVSCGLPFVWLFAFPIAIILALVLGVPAILLFCRLGYRKWWHFTLGGALIALPFWVLYFWPFNDGHWYATWHYNSIQFFASGAIGGTLFWWLTVYRKCALTSTSS